MREGGTGRKKMGGQGGGGVLTIDPYAEFSPGGHRCGASAQCI